MRYRKHMQIGNGSITLDFDIADIGIVVRMRFRPPLSAHVQVGPLSLDFYMSNEFPF